MTHFPALTRFLRLGISLALPVRVSSFSVLLATDFTGSVVSVLDKASETHDGSIPFWTQTQNWGIPGWPNFKERAKTIA